MYKMTDPEITNARRKADEFILRMKSDDSALGEALLATAMILTVQIRCAFVGIREIDAQLLDQVVDVVKLELFRQISSDIPDAVADDVGDQIPKLEKHLAEIDFLIAEPPGGHA